MRGCAIWVFTIGLASTTALAQNGARGFGPVGLVMSAGATLVRGAQSLAAKPGEVLFSGDTLRTGESPVTFLFCPQKQSATLARGSEVVLAQDSYQIKSGGIQQQRQIAACFLPPAQRLSVASMQHYGVLIARSGSVPPPATTLEQRVAALPAPLRDQLNAELAACDAEIAQEPEDLSALVGKAAAYERAGLLFDAGDAYRKIAESSPGLAWIRAKVLEIERELEREHASKE